MRGQRRQDVLNGTVFVDVTGHAERRKFADFLCAADRAAEYENRQPAIVNFPDTPHQLDTRLMGKTEIDDEQIDLDQICTDSRKQLRRALNGDRPVSGVLECGLETVADERGIVRNENGLCAGGR